MKPEVDEIWKDALERFNRAKRHLAAGEFDSAKDEAINSAISGQFAIMLVLRGRENDRKLAGVAADEECVVKDNWDKTCSRPEDHISKAEKLLRRFSNLSPPENKLFFE